MPFDQIDVIAVPISGPFFEKALKATADAHAKSLPFFVTEAQVIEQARPIIAEFLARIKAAQSV